MGLCGHIDGILLLAMVPLHSVVSVFVFVPFHVFVFLDAIAPTPASGSVSELWSVLPISGIAITSSELVHIHHCLKLETPLSGSRSVLDRSSWCFDVGAGPITNSCTFLLLYLSVYLYFHIHHCFKIQTPLSSSRSVLMLAQLGVRVRGPSTRSQFEALTTKPPSHSCSLIVRVQPGDMTNMQPAHMS